VKDDGSCKRLDWMCDNKIDCIPAWHVCDRAPDCPDKSDELECPDLNAKIENAPETELHVLNTVGESIQAEAQEQIKKEKQKTGVQIILPLSLGLILLALALVMVYLRYRQARHLAGLGQSQYKQLPKEDTDYLVNGMYM